METDSLEIFVWSHYPFWMIHNFASENCFLLWYLMKMTSNETSFALLRSIIAEGDDAYVHLRKCIKTVVNFEKTCQFIQLCCRNKLLENNGSYNQMTEEMARDHLKNIFQPLISRIFERKSRSKEQVRYLWWFPRITRPNMYCGNHPWGGGGG